MKKSRGKQAWSMERDRFLLTQHAHLEPTFPQVSNTLVFSATRAKASFLSLKPIWIEFSSLAIERLLKMGQKLRFKLYNENYMSQVLYIFILCISNFKGWTQILLLVSACSSPKYRIIPNPLTKTSKQIILAYPVPSSLSLALSLSQTALLNGWNGFVCLVGWFFCLSILRKEVGCVFWFFVFEGFFYFCFFAYYWSRSEI